MISMICLSHGTTFVPAEYDFGAEKDGALEVAHLPSNRWFNALRLWLI